MQTLLWITMIPLLGKVICGDSVQDTSYSNAAYGPGIASDTNRRSFGVGDLGNRYSGVPVGASLGNGLGVGYGSSHGGYINSGFNIGNGYLGYSNYQRSKPIVYQTRQPVSTIFYEPVPAKPSFSVTPSISYGYSYKLVPTYAYGPRPAQHLNPSFQQAGLYSSLGKLGGSLNGLLGGRYG